MIETHENDDLKFNNTFLKLELDSIILLYVSTGNRELLKENIEKVIERLSDGIYQPFSDHLQPIYQSYMKEVKK